MPWPKHRVQLESEELGIAPLIAAALPALAPIAENLLGGLLGGLGGGGGSSLPAAISGGIGLDINSIKGVIEGLLSRLPAEIRNELRGVLAEIREGATTKEDLARNIQAALAPQITAALANLQQAQIQREATSEHNNIAKTDARWNTINNKLDILNTKVEEYKAANRRKMAAFGMPNV